jgi:hypothetical protein
MATDHLRQICEGLVSRQPLQQRQWVEEHLEVLFRPEADRTLLLMSGEQGDAFNAWVNATREALKLAKQYGVEQSYTRFHQALGEAFRACELLLETPTIRDMKATVEQYPVLTQDLGLVAMDSIRSHQGKQVDKQAEFWPGVHLVFLFKCRQFGLDHAIEELRDGRDDYWFVQEKPW